jgi:cyclopropane fatty-acyl-phospholipid synthase-like methyltransferase
MPYVLESKEEFARLERQSKNPSYSFERELSALNVPTGARILDAGCGSGLVTRYLTEQFPTAKAQGCDFSAERVAQAQAAAPSLEFTQCDLRDTPFPTNTFDIIVSRYVFQHLGHKKAAAALKELYRILKPNGTLLLIDGDGLFVNLYPQTAIVTSSLRAIERAGIVDFSVGRKLPNWMQKAGFHNLAWHLNTANHEGASRAAEVQLMRDRFVTGAAHFRKVLGAEKAKAFARDFVRGLADPAATYFTETFVVIGVKPSPLKLAKRAT